MRVACSFQQVTVAEGASTISTPDGTWSSTAVSHGYWNGNARSRVPVVARARPGCDAVLSPLIGSVRPLSTLL